MRKKLQRLLWVAPVAMLLFAGAASAQTTGTIVGVVNDAATGKPVAGALVIATSKSLQGEQTAVTDGKGAYTLTALPPGIYRVTAQLQGFKPAERTDLNLRVDFTLRANIAMVPEAVQVEEQVVTSGVAPAVNIGSAEAGTIVSREFLATVPTTRTFEQVATVAPTAQNDGYGVSFAGATSPENNYIIDGLRVTSTIDGTMGTNLLTNFIDQLDVKVGSFMPEYGYSTAGVINAVTKSGGNEFHGSIWGNITPGFFTPATPLTYSAYAVATQSTPYKGGYDADFGLEVGGPIVKDKLWFYAGFAPRMIATARTSYFQQRQACSPPGSPGCSANDPSDPNAGGWKVDANGNYIMSTISGSDQAYLNAQSTQYNAIAKLTWLVSENHNLSAAFNTQPKSDSTFTPNAGQMAGTSAWNSNSTNVTLSYTGKFLDKHLLAEVRGGWYNQNLKYTPTVVGPYDSFTSPRIVWGFYNDVPLESVKAGFTCPGNNPLACPARNWSTGGRAYTEAPTENRYAGSASLTALFELGGQHQLKAGAQIDYGNVAIDRFYGGGGLFYARGVPGTTSTANSTTTNSFFMTRGYGVPDRNNMISSTKSHSFCGSFTLDSAGNFVCVNEGLKNGGTTLSATANTWDNGFFLQDSWTIANVLTLNFGVRWDQQKVTTPTGQASYAAVGSIAPDLNINDSWAPRVQAIWDFTGNGRGKVQANWGMYYEAIPLDMAVRAFNPETTVRGYYQMGTCNASTDPKVNEGLNPFVSCPNTFGNLVGQGPGPNNLPLPQPLASSANGFRFSGNSGGYEPIAPGIKAPWTQQFGGGIQYEILQDLTLGIDYLGRRLGNVVEDMSGDDANTYFIANPASSKPFTVTQNVFGNAETTTYNPSYANGLSTQMGTIFTAAWPKPQRDYDGFTITLNKLFSKRWLAQASYTWSSLRGNYSGLFRTQDDQLDPNLGADYDLIYFLGNGYGPLGLNRTNQIKVAGSYTGSLSSDVSIVPSINFKALSGVPQSAYGIDQFYQQPLVNIVPIGMAGNLPWTYQLDLGAKVLWAISGQYTLQFSLDIFNILNMQTVQWTDQTYTTSNVLPMQGAQCGAKTAINADNKWQALQNDCPDLPYLRTIDGSRPTVNLNYGQALGSNNGRVAAYQVPIAARFGIQLSF